PASADGPSDAGALADAPPGGGVSTLTSELGWLPPHAATNAAARNSPARAPRGRAIGAHSDRSRRTGQRALGLPSRERSHASWIACRIDLRSAAPVSAHRLDRHPLPFPGHVDAG